MQTLKLRLNLMIFLMQEFCKRMARSAYFLAQRARSAYFELVYGELVFQKYVKPRQDGSAYPLAQAMHNRHVEQLTKNMTRKALTYFKFLDYGSRCLILITQLIIRQ